MFFGVWRGRQGDHGLGLRGRVVEWHSCVDKDDDEGRRIDVVVCVDLGTVNAGVEESWSSREWRRSNAQQNIYATPF